MSLVRITTEQVVAIYEKQVDAGSLRAYGLLDGAVAAPFQYVFDKEPYPTLAHKAGKLLDGIQRVQAFTDGNKRLAWLATTSFLDLNGQMVRDMPQEEVDDFVRGLTEDASAHITAALWLNDRMVTLS